MVKYQFFQELIYSFQKEILLFLSNNRIFTLRKYMYMNKIKLLLNVVNLVK